MTGNTSSGFGTGGGRTTDLRTNDGSAVPADDGNAVTADDGSAAVESLTDPAALADRGDVESGERSCTHAGDDYCEAEASDRAVVGVTNDDGEVLLLVTADGEHAILPNCVVDPSGDWVAVARNTAEASTGMPVELDGVEAVRRVEHAVETDDGDARHDDTTYHVVFAGAPASEYDGSAPAITDDPDWTAGWYGELPVGVDEEGDVVADIRRFLD